jgi:heme exporter protein D
VNDYSFFIWAAYGVAGVTIGVMALRIVLEYRRLRAELARYGAAGARDMGDGA